MVIFEYDLKKNIFVFLGAAIRYPGHLSHAFTTGHFQNNVNGKHFDPFLVDIGPLLGIKCDVCVLSEERQVFRLLDAILESNLWPLEKTTTRKKKHEKKEKPNNLHLTTTQAQIAMNGKEC